ncbi:hypothetical protein GMRT_11591 [Giardia muris]|uniref:Uncharacterized protein n=1 Tax=Giardia muris TaxID=5742 RepID=A0A4Z1T471_GIAMU|nr:hypothetical protein GMRT_11591 [Giardia muris]|eukprot:TNJ27211.1 hypothetical protein GMRT_11591 [Giardia muris]
MQSNKKRPADTILRGRPGLRLAGSLVVGSCSLLCVLRSQKRPSAPRWLGPRPCRSFGLSVTTKTRRERQGRPRGRLWRTSSCNPGPKGLLDCPYLRGIVHRPSRGDEPRPGRLQVVRNRSRQLCSARSHRQESFRAVVAPPASSRRGTASDVRPTGALRKGGASFLDRSRARSMLMVRACSSRTSRSVLVVPGHLRRTG